MDIDEIFSSFDNKGLAYNPSSLLLSLLQVSIQNDAKLDAIVILLADINAKLDGIAGDELDSESTEHLKRIYESINEASKTSYSKVMARILT